MLVIGARIYDNTSNIYLQDALTYGYLACLIPLMRYAFLIAFATQLYDDISDLWIMLTFFGMTIAEVVANFYTWFSAKGKGDPHANSVTFTLFEEIMWKASILAKFMNWGWLNAVIVILDKWQILPISALYYILYVAPEIVMYKAYFYI